MNNLKYYRKNADFTQEELAERSGISRYSIARLETGNAEFTERTLRAVCSALGVSADDILGLKKVNKGEVSKEIETI